LGMDVLFSSTATAELEFPLHGTSHNLVTSFPIANF